MNYGPRMPVRFVPGNEEMLKSQAGIGPQSAGAGPGASDFAQTEDVPTVAPYDHYRAPLDRVHGNEMARRYPDGSLDVDYMKHKVLDALRKAKDGVQLNALEELALTVLFPTSFSYVDDGLTSDLAKVNLKITPMESMQVAQAVAEHLCYQYDYLRFKRQ